MKAITIKQRTIRLAGIAGLTIGLALSSGVAAAHSPVGLTECDYAGCAIVTKSDISLRRLADVTASQDNFVSGPLRPHFTR